jgi:mediator of RNA polymerase II transcription subunit 18
MSTHLYEVALFGDFFAKDLKPILNRIALHSESSHAMHTREVVFEPLDAQQQRDQGQDPVMLRARKELLDEKPTWYVRSWLDD